MENNNRPQTENSTKNKGLCGFCNKPTTVMQIFWVLWASVNNDSADKTWELKAAQNKYKF
jgi:hypothetical protein